MKIILLLSGGLDSSVMLAMAAQQGKDVHAISFDYGQRHKLELSYASDIASLYGATHQIITLDPTTFSLSTLVSSGEVPKRRDFDTMFSQGTPSTYVPARNTLFLSFALGQAEIRGAREIHFGPNAYDQHCYPDCTNTFVAAYQNVINCATEQSITGNAPRLMTPLLSWDKQRIIEEGMALEVPFERTWSCYDPKENHRHCGECDACVLRKEGFAKLDQIDPVM